MLLFGRPSPDTVASTAERHVPGRADPIRHEHQHRYLFAAPYCRDRVVLDVACGDGYGAHLLAQVAAGVVGLDVDVAAIGSAQARYGVTGARFVAGDGTAMPLREATFDVVIGLETIEHIADTEKFLTEVARVLRPGGLLIVSSPNRPVRSDSGTVHDPLLAREFDKEAFAGVLRGRFGNVALFGQRTISGSVIISDKDGAAPARMQDYESDDGIAYRESYGLPSPRYLIALASDSPLPDIGESLMFDDSTLASLTQAAARRAEAEAEDAARRAITSLAEISDRLQRAERQLLAYRASSEEWARRAARTESPQPLAEAPPLPAAVKSPARRRRKNFVSRLIRRWRSMRLDRRVRREFDARYYLKRNPDVAASKVDPFRHYRQTGWREERDPNRFFSTKYYLESNPDVRASGMNPFVHYIAFGRAEGRPPAPESDSLRQELIDARVAPVPILQGAPPAEVGARLVAFYLPQFHAIAENDAWWGKGFTEWTNVRRAYPHFEGHDQPRLPGELGYYNLLDADVQRRQIELARLYGVGGFCFYFYWFNGKRLLERPVEAWLADRSLDFPFCLCWANENWTRRWDGRDDQVLIGQTHSPEDDLAFISAAAPYLKDPRYIRVGGKPILVVYRPSLLPSATDTAKRWREWCRHDGIGEIHLAYAQSFEQVDPAVFGFDAAIEFPPNNSHPPNLTETVLATRKGRDVKVFDWRVFNERSKHYTQPGYTLYRAVCPSWDNTPRSAKGGTVFVNNTPELYREWLSNAVGDTAQRFNRPDERLVFINAWNEWAEGAYLEPDASYGYAWLQATRDAVTGTASTRAAKGRAARPGPEKVARQPVIVVSHDAHPHGAQYLALHLARALAEMGREVHMIVLGDGPLLPRFREFARVLSIGRAAAESVETRDQLRQLYEAGVRVAFVNTTVSGVLVPALKQAGFTTVALIHEMPGVLRDHRLEREARSIGELADRIVFAAGVVKEGFEAFSGIAQQRATIMAQGVIRKNPFRDRPEEARRLVCERHGLPSATRIVLSVAFVDHRKGADLFVEIAERVLRSHEDLAFIWVGHADSEMERKVQSLICEKQLAGRVRFVGFVAEPLEYYAAASVYALTSREDPFPNAVLESTEAGVPVVAFRGTTGAAEFIVEHGGRLADAFDAEHFAGQIGELLSRSASPAGARIPSIRQYALDLTHLATGEPRVSVVVPNFNYARHIRARLESILGQTYPVYEIVVLDDASTDDSVAAARSILDAHAEVDARLLVNQRNSGSAFRQWQKGVSQCRGDLVWIAEADDVAEPGFLDQLVPAFRNSRVVLAYCQSMQIDARDAVIAPDYLRYTSDISDAWHDDYVHTGTAEIADALAIKNTIPNVSAVLWRKSALERTFSTLGEKLFEYRMAGDWLVYMHTLLHGDIAFTAQVFNRHRRHRGSIIGGIDGRRHLAEVVAMQKAAAALVPVTDSTRVKGQAWLSHVQSHLNVTADEKAL